MVFAIAVNESTSDQVTDSHKHITQQNRSRQANKMVLNSVKIGKKKEQVNYSAD